MAEHPHRFSCLREATCLWVIHLHGNWRSLKSQKTVKVMGMLLGMINWSAGKAYIYHTIMPKWISTLIRVSVQQPCWQYLAWWYTVRATFSGKTQFCSTPPKYSENNLTQYLPVIYQISDGNGYLLSIRKWGRHSTRQCFYCLCICTELVHPWCHFRMLSVLCGFASVCAVS